MSASDATIKRLFDILGTVPELAVRTQHLDDGEVLVDHALHAITLHDGLAPEDATRALLQALIELDHGPHRQDQAARELQAILHTEG